MKKLCIIALVFVLTFALAACGRRNDDNTNNTTLPTTVPTTAPPVADTDQTTDNGSQPVDSIWLIALIGGGHSMTPGIFLHTGAEILQQRIGHAREEVQFICPQARKKCICINHLLTINP